MKSKRCLLFPAILASCAISYSQPWSGILDPTRAVNWTTTGIPGGIPSGPWTQSGASITASSGDRTATIQAALNACGTNHFVQLGSGTFNVTSLTVPSNCALRGQGANLTILNATGTGSAGVVVLGSPSTTAPGTANDTAITAGLTQGSTNITVASASNISVGSLLVISELNDLNFGVQSTGSEGYCNWCDGNYGGTRSAGQIVLVTNVSGTSVTISPGLYKSYGGTLQGWTASKAYPTSAFITSGGHYYKQTATPGSVYACTSGASIPALTTNGTSVTDGTCTWVDQGVGTTTLPLATPFTPAAIYAGVENLQIYANNTGAGDNVGFGECQYCWVSGVEGNFTDADHVGVYWSYFGQIQNSYWSGAYAHTAGSYDSCLRLAQKTSGFIVQNNIFERLHVSIMLEWGASGNVIGHNYALAGFDTGSTNVVIGGIDYHGAHPMFNLHEGNILVQDYFDSVWGSSSDNTIFREWVQGTAAVCSPLNNTRTTVNCTGTNKYYPFQASRGFQVSYLSTNNNFVGSLVGSPAQQSNVAYGTAVASVNSVQWSTNRIYDTTVYGWTFGYGEVQDSGSWALDNGNAFNSAFQHGNYSNIAATTAWHTGTTQTLPASFYLAAKPSWWGSLPYPAIGPDVTGGSGPGGHSYANPAMHCYQTIMGGSDGGPGSPLSFNSSACYSNSSSSPVSPPTNISATVR